MSPSPADTGETLASNVECRHFPLPPPRIAAAGVLVGEVVLVSRMVAAGVVVLGATRDYAMVRIWRLVTILWIPRAGESPTTCEHFRVLLLLELLTYVGVYSAVGIVFDVCVQTYGVVLHQHV